MHREGVEALNKDSMELVLSAIFVLCVIGTLVSTMALFFALRKRLSNVSFFFSSTIGYLPAVYFQNRRRIGTRRLDLLVGTSILTFVLAVVIAVVLANAFPIQ